METILEYLVFGAAVISLVGLTTQVIRTLSFGRRNLLAEKRGDWKKGVIYAFGKGMMPWEKESAKKHLLTYGAGFGYHFGIFSAFFYLFLSMTKYSIPAWMMLIFQFFMISGLSFGLGLLLKRAVKAQMRLISCPDDYISNILVDVFLVLAFLNSLSFPVYLPFLGVSMILLLYLPAGKIRHCFFFFYSRILFGHFFGRRGVFPKNKPLYKV